MFEGRKASLCTSVLPKKNQCHECDWGGRCSVARAASYISLDVSVSVAYYPETSSNNNRTLVVVCKRRCLWYVLVLALIIVIKL